MSSQPLPKPGNKVFELGVKPITTAGQISTITITAAVGQVARLNWTTWTDKQIPLLYDFGGLCYLGLLDFVEFS